MKFVGYNTYLDDPHLWMRPMKRSIDDFKQYEYVLIYVTNILAIGDDTTEVLQNIDKYFVLNPGSLSDTNIYLSAKLNPTRLENGVVAWSLSLLQYIQESVRKMEQYVKENLGYLWDIPKTAVNPFPCGYEPPLDVLPELDTLISSYYQYHNGILQWMVELGRLDINIEVLILTSHLELLREGHLEALLRIISYLQGKNNYG